MSTNSLPKGVLLDLDGTLLDTAPDMVAALQPICERLNVPVPAYEFARDYVSMGSAGLLRGALPDLDEHEIAALVPDYLEIYAANLAKETRLFAGMEELLNELERAGIRWGVITNKPAFLTEPLMKALQLYNRSACVVSGDTLPQRKPQPEPILLGMREAGLTASQTLYVGDAERDIQAGRNAGIKTVAALYGYILPEDNPAGWHADYSINHPGELLELITQL
jgi:N-acetyl-D-muramate 6-phosphate phosphatase